MHICNALFNKGNLMKIMKIALILPIIFLVGCSTNPTKNENRMSDRPPASEILNGPGRLSYLMNDNLTLDDFKGLFKDDFNEKSKNFSPQTNCYEYRAHIYPSLNKPLLVGFDKSNQYVYHIDISSPKPENRNKVVWVKELRKDMEKIVEAKMNS